MKRARIPPLSESESRFFRDQLREARAVVLVDAEGYHGIVAALERLGAVLSPNDYGFGRLRGKLLSLAAKSPAAPRSNSEHRLGPRLEDLFEMVRVGRNDAVHHGAYARHLARRCIHLAIYVEDGLMAYAQTVGDVMVREPAIAEGWQPVAVARQRMLAESYSSLPILWNRQWHLLTDHAVAAYMSGQRDRAAALRRRIEDVLKEGSLKVLPATVMKPSDTLAEAVARCQGSPVVVVDKQTLVGIATPFDFL